MSGYRGRFFGKLSVSRLSILARSLAFNALFYANLLVHMIAALPTLMLPHAVLRAFIRSYARSSLWLLRVICGTEVCWRGTENIPQGACIVACKHQSAWETFALYTVLEDPIYILKRELMWIPLFGWYTWKAGLIPVDRSAGMAALARMTARAQKAMAGPRPRQLVIFPEGTRRMPGAEPNYKPGIVHLYAKIGLPCVPAALNSGLFWPRRSLVRLPGTIVVEFLPPIAPGFDRTGFLAHLQDTIEDASARLLQETVIRNRGSGIRNLIPDN
jgi:1-acyl-sn-glycerol-3-phosphate acyltransferase